MRVKVFYCLRRRRGERKLQTNTGHNRKNEGKNEIMATEIN